MKRSELIKELMEQKTADSDPEISFWISETEQLILLSVYTNYNDTKICVDMGLK